MKRKRKKSKRQKRIDDPRSSLWRTKADTVWSKIVRAKAGHVCAVCGGPGTQAHHVIRRESNAHRHNPFNGLCLCFGCHRGSSRLSAHLTPTEFSLWMRDTKPDLWAWSDEHRNDIFLAPDFKVRFEGLTAILRDQAEEKP